MPKSNLFIDLRRSKFSCNSLKNLPECDQKVQIAPFIHTKASK